jgi:outer membrane protein OmpA-like peptidoglycan-associated protein
MSFNLLDSISGLVRTVPPEALALTLTEPQAQVARALEAAGPLLLAGIAQQCHDLNRCGTLLEALDRTPVATASNNSMAHVFAASAAGLPAFLSAGRAAFQDVFPERQAAVAVALAKVAGLRSASAVELLSFMMMLVIISLKKQVEQENMGAAGLQALMAAQSSTIAPRLDERLTPSLNVTPSTGSSPAVAAVVIETVQQVAWTWRRWLAWGAWGAAVLLAVVWFGKLSNPMPSNPADTAVISNRPMPGAPSVASRPTAIAPSLEKIYFDSERYETPDSTTRRLAAILEYARLHGNSRVLLTGFHDAGNESEPVLRLARQRAMAVRSAIIASGVSEDRIVLEKKSEQKALVGEREASRVEVSIAQ